MKHIVLLSGGHSSAIVAINLKNKFGKKNVTLLNHDINPKMEDPDIKRFKREVADYCGLPIEYANIKGITNPEELPDQFDVCMEAGALTDQAGHALCTNRLKTEPFHQWLEVNYPRGVDLFRKEEEACCLYYGFDAKEGNRILRRKYIMGGMGYDTEYPLATWKHLDITSTKQVGIEPPLTYALFEHANCFGCLKASLLHWYVTYVHKPYSWYKGIAMEEFLKYSIHTIIRKGVGRAIFLTELQPIFEQMHQEGVPATEHQSKMKFARSIAKYQIEESNPGIPCECITN